MLVYRMWTTEKRSDNYRLVWRRTWDGWLLFGLLPLYVRMRSEER